MDPVSQLWQTSDASLVEEMCDIEERMRQDHARMLRVVAEIEGRGVATKLGYSNTPALLVHVLRITRAEARHRLTHAEELMTTTTPTGSVVEPSLPLTAAALQRGEIGSGHVDVIEKTLRGMAHLDASQRAWAEELLLVQAEEDDPAALARHAGRIRDIVDPDGPPPTDDDPTVPQRALRRHVRRDGRMEFKGWLDPENAALFESLLTPFEKSDPEVPDTRGYAERAGDAFTDVLRMAANCPELPTKNGVRTEVAFTIPLDALMAMADDTVLPGQSSYLTAREARRIACDCHVLPAVMGGDSQPLDIAVPAYVVPAHIRRALVLRDRGCAFPSCDRPASVCDAHHILSWLRGGPTQLEKQSFRKLYPSRYLADRSGQTVGSVRSQTSPRKFSSGTSSACASAISVISGIVGPPVHWTV